MKLTVEFPSVSYREGPQGVIRLARAIEQIGYDHIDMFDHVVMGYPMAGREPGPYPAQMPILEAFMALPRGPKAASLEVQTGAHLRSLVFHTDSHRNGVGAFLHRRRSESCSRSSTANSQTQCTSNKLKWR